MLLLTFTVGANRYAIDVTRVVEVVPRVELRKISQAPAFLAGLLDYRGRIVPVIDLGLLLDGAPCQDCLSTRIILVNDTPIIHNRTEQDHDDAGGATGEARVNRNQELDLLGLVAECVSDLTNVRPDQIAPIPVWLPQAPYLGAIVQTDAGLVQLIVGEKLREASLRSSSLGESETVKSISET
jgi:chemotaxis-related protein WspB